MNAIMFKDRLGEQDTERCPSFRAEHDSALEMLQETGPRLR